MLKCRPKSWPRMLITIPNYIVLISVLGSSVLISIFDSRELTSSPGSKYVPDFLMGWSTYPLTSSPRNHTILEHCNTMVVTKISFFLLRSFSSYVASQAPILVSVFCLLSFFKKKKTTFWLLLRRRIPLDWAWTSYPLRGLPPARWPDFLFWVFVSEAGGKGNTHRVSPPPSSATDGLF